MICCEIVVKMLWRWYFSFNSLQRDNTYINIYIYIGSHFATQAQDVWDLGPACPVQ